MTDMINQDVQRALAAVGVSGDFPYRTFGPFSLRPRVQPMLAPEAAAPPAAAAPEPVTLFAAVTTAALADAAPDWMETPAPAAEPPEDLPAEIGEVVAQAPVPPDPPAPPAEDVEPQPPADTAAPPPPPPPVVAVAEAPIPPDPPAPPAEDVEPQPPADTAAPLPPPAPMPPVVAVAEAPIPPDPPAPPAEDIEPQPPADTAAPLPPPVVAEAPQPERPDLAERLYSALSERRAAPAAKPSAPTPELALFQMDWGGRPDDDGEASSGSGTAQAPAAAPELPGEKDMFRRL